MKAVQAETIIHSYIGDYLQKNQPARKIAQQLTQLGIGLRPLVDHITVRTHDVFKRSEEFMSLGFIRDMCVGPNGILDYGDWFAIVLRKPGLPAIFIDQGKTGSRGKTSVIPEWVNKFGDTTLHHVAILVDDIEKSVREFKKMDISFAGKIVGKRGSLLRQIFTTPEIKKGEPFTVLEIAERHLGFQGFQPPQADSLMQSTRLKKKSSR